MHFAQHFDLRLNASQGASECRCRWSSRGEFGLGEVLRLPGLTNLVVAGMSSRKLCVFRHIWVRERQRVRLGAPRLDAHKMSICYMPAIGTQLRDLYLSNFVRTWRGLDSFGAVSNSFLAQLGEERA